MTDEPLQLEYAGPRRRRGWARRHDRPRRGLIAEAFDLVGSAVAWAFIAIVALAVLGGFVFLFAGPVIGFPSLVLCALFVPMLAAAARAVRRQRATAVLAYLDQAVRLNQPLDRLLAAAERSETGKVAIRLADLRAALATGLSMTDALAATVPELDARAAGAIAHGEATGRLAQALHRLLREDTRRSRQMQDDAAFAAWYPPLLLAVVAAVLAIIGVFVLPKYDRILRDFHVPMPWATRWLIECIDWLPYLGLPVGLALLVGLGWQLRHVFHGDRLGWLLRWPRDRMLWYTPVVGPVQRDRNLADLCDALAESAERGLPLDAGLLQAGRLHLNGVLRQRVSRWAGGLAGGQDPAAAGRAARMPPAVVGLLATSASAGALRFAARFYAGRLAVRRALLAAAFVPVVTTAIGLLVALVALALFLPIRDMIDHLSPNVGGL
jgi:type II secretory pathway component PulF